MHILLLSSQYNSPSLTQWAYQSSTNQVIEEVNYRFSRRAVESHEVVPSHLPTSLTKLCQSNCERTQDDARQPTRPSIMSADMKCKIDRGSFICRWTSLPTGTG